MADHWIKRRASDYALAINNLLPTGLAWPRDASSVLQQLVNGLSAIWEDVENAVDLLLNFESDPRITNILLPDWERAWGLPDLCLDEPVTTSDRQKALVLRITLLGAQDRQFFIDLAASIGYTVTITEYRPFVVGLDRVGDNREWFGGTSYGDYPYILGPPDNRFYWTVHVGVARLTWFRATKGQLGVDHHLTIGLATDLECLFRRYKPAHTDIIFDYSGLATGGAMAGTP